MRPSSTTRPSTCRKIRYSSRSDIAAIMPDRWRPPITAGQRRRADVLEPHRATERGSRLYLAGCSAHVVRLLHLTDHWSALDVIPS